MTLIAKRMEPIFKSDDPLFNAKAAQESYDLVMKMDVDEARLFTSMVVAETLWENIAKNRRSIQSHLDRVVAKRLDEVKKSTRRAYISKRADESWDDSEAILMATALAEISKAIPNPYWDENKVRRNQSGQFTIKIKSNPKMKPMSPRNETMAGIPKQNGKGQPRLTSEARSRYQQEYMQVAAALNSFGADQNTSIVLRNNTTGDVSEIATKGTTVPRRGRDALWNPNVESVIAVNAKPENLSIGGASFDVISALGGNQERAAYGSALATNLGEGGQLNAFQESWNKANAANDSRSMAQLASGSAFLGQVAPVGSKAQIAATFGSYVGTYGPEAEKIIGPKARKTAYRYRGTEKEPEREVLAAYNSRVSAKVDPITGKAIPSTENKVRTRVAQTKAIEAAEKKAGKPLSDAQKRVIMDKAKARVRNDTTVSAEGRVSARQEVGAALLRKDKAPRGDLYGLHLASGHLPPSEGVIIDRKGKVVVQAVGYADDHYLPFNLKNLTKLKNGEYVRTRAVGGPTSEDVYTGLVTGAKHVTVKSRSGTYMVEFHEDFQGTRRYNDKAARMVDRYEKLLDAVQSGQVRRSGKDIHPDIRAKIISETEARSDFWRKTPEEKKQAKSEALESYRRTTELTEIDEEFIRLRAQAITMGDPNKTKASAEKETRDALLADKELNFQLNGRGYKDALDSLQEQFPYYIKKVTWIPDQADEDRNATTKDLGYVMARHNRPAAAQAGYFDERIAGKSREGANSKFKGTGKYSAADADYQNFGNRRGQESTEAQTAKDVSTDPKKDDVSSPNTPEGRSPAARKKIQDRLDYVSSATEVYSKVKPKLGGDKDFENVSVDDFRIAMAKNDPKITKAWDDFMRDKGVQVLGDGANAGLVGQELANRYRMASGKVSNIYNKEERFIPSDEPEDFPEDAYTKEATPEVQQAELARRNQFSVLEPSQMIADMSDADLKKEIVEIGRLQNMKEAFGDDFVAQLASSGGTPNAGTARIDAGDTDELVENVHRMRQLKRMMEVAGLEAAANPSNTVNVATRKQGLHNRQANEAGNNNRSGIVEMERRRIVEAMKKAVPGTAEADELALLEMTIQEKMMDQTITDADLDAFQSDLDDFDRDNPGLLGPRPPKKKASS